MRLFPSTATTFTTNGLGILSDAITATVTQEINGEFELMIQYPVSGIHASEIESRSIITAKADKLGDEQPFRVYRITKPLNGIFTIYARHIAYDMSGIVINPFTASTLGTALQRLVTNASSTCPFSFWTDKSVATGFTLEVPKSLWALLGGSEGSILDTYRGEWEFDGYTAKLWNKRGSNRGVVIRYGKNMTGYEQDLDAAGVYTGVYPYYAMNGTLVTLTEKIVNVSGTFDFTKILSLDLTSSFNEAPTEAQLRARAQKYITDNEIGTPDISWSVEFVQMEQSLEYGDLALLERITIGDTVTVDFERYGTHATARVVAVEFDVLLDRYETVTLGKVKSSLADTIVAQQREIEEKPSVSLVEQIAESLADSILDAVGGCVRILDTNNDGMADELYIADNADPTQAHKVWRYNYQGWAASTNGYNGPFSMGATLEDGLLATFVTAAHLTAGTISSADGQAFYLNLDENVLRMAAVTQLSGAVDDLGEDLDTQVSNLQATIAATETDIGNSVDAKIAAESANTDSKIATEAASRDSAIASAINGLDDHIDAVEAGVNSALIPMNELLQYIQVGNIGTAQNPVYGVKIGKADLVSAFKSVFTATALEFYENGVRTAFLSNQKLNTNTIRTAAMELVESANMGDPSAVDWLITLDNGYTIKYVGGGS